MVKVCSCSPFLPRMKFYHVACQLYSKVTCNLFFLFFFTLSASNSQCTCLLILGKGFFKKKKKKFCFEVVLIKIKLLHFQQAKE